MDWDKFKKIMSKAELARQLGITPMAVSQWRNRDIPAKYVLKIEALTKGQISRYEMRPDLYPIERVS